MSRNLDYAKIARHPSQSVAPELWPSHAWVPAMGPTGATLFDLCGNKPATLNGGIYTPLGVDTSSGGFSTIATDFKTSKTLSFFTTVSSIYLPLSGYDYIFTRADSGYALSAIGVALLFRNSSGLKIALNIRNTSGTLLNALISQEELGVGSHSIGFVIGEYGYKLFVNGFLKSSDTYGDSGDFWSPTDEPVYFGQSRTNTSGYQYLGSIGCGYISYNNWDDNFFSQLHKDPLLPFRRRLPVFYSVPSAGGTADCLFDGWLKIIKTATNAFDGAAAIANLSTSVFDGEAIVSYTTDSQFDGEVLVKNTATNTFDGIASISKLDTDVFDGSMTIKNTCTALFDGEATIKSIATSIIDGLIIVANNADAMFDGTLTVKSTTYSVFDGEAIIKSTSTTLFDGDAFVTDGEATSTFDGSATIIRVRPDHMTNAQAKALIEALTYKDATPQSAEINVTVKTKIGRTSNIAKVIIEPL